MMKIKLTQGKVALVDDTDFMWLSRWKWHAHKDHENFYACRRVLSSLGVNEHLSMHRQILGLEFGDSRQGDHKNHNTLDNRRENIRIATLTQNRGNQKIRSGGTSKYKGVCWVKQRKKWHAQLAIKSKSKSLGFFMSERTAAFAYNLAAKKYFGKFALLNKI